MDWKFENIPVLWFVLHAYHVIYLAQETYTFFMDLKSLPSFVLHTFLLIYLAQDTSIFSWIGI